MDYVVITDWDASYADPIRVEAGARVKLTGRQEEWDGYRWLWAVSATGLEGWIPDSLITEGADGPCAREDYSAVELTCRAGDRVSGGRHVHGWVWCHTQSGHAGWVPRRHLRPVAHGGV